MEEACGLLLSGCSFAAGQDHHATRGFFQSWFQGDTDMFAFGLFFAIVFTVLLICFIEACHRQIVRDVADLIRTQDKPAP